MDVLQGCAAGLKLGLVHLICHHLGRMVGYVYAEQHVSAGPKELVELADLQHHHYYLLSYPFSVSGHLWRLLFTS